LAKDTDNPNDEPGDQAPPEDTESSTKVIDQPIEDELKDSYLTYAMSVIVSRALPDVRDGLKPSQRRILVAMNDLNLSPGGRTTKCAGIVGETMKRYHPHGDAAIYPTLVRMAQEWNTRHVLIAKQGNFGSIAGLPPAQMRYTEAKLSSVATMMLDDLKLDTVDYVPNYDESLSEPSVLPSRFPNLLVNGGMGIAVGMATSIPPHNVREVCDAAIRVILDPDVTINELLEIVTGPDFPTGGIICGRSGIRQGYHTGRANVVVRARATIEATSRNRSRIVVTEIPYQQFRDRVIERIAALVNSDRIKGISGIRDESDLNEPVRLVIDLKRDADPEVVLNQLYQFSPLQDTFSIILLALVDSKPRTLNLKEILQEFVRHRVTVIRRRTQFLLSKARQRKHTVEGLLLALADIEEIIRLIRASKTQAEAKSALMLHQCPASLLERALGEEGFQRYQEEAGIADTYSLSAVQADAILKMTLGQLVNLEQEKLSGEHQKLLAEIGEYLTILSDQQNIFEIIKADLEEIKRRFGEDRRTEISGEELGNIDLEDLITEETMVVSISHSGYIKRTPASVYRAQRRGGKGLKGAKTEEEDPIEQLFVASTHAYLLFFTNKGRVYWQKVYGLPQLSRESRGRAVVNLLNLGEDEKITDCRAVRDFDQPGHFLMMATRRGLVKKTPLEAYSRPRTGGIIAIKLRENDELVDVVVTKPGDEVVIATVKGMAIRFKESDARPMGRNSSGVKGIQLSTGDELVGMVVADPGKTLLTVCENGYGKRTQFGPGSNPGDGDPGDGDPGDGDPGDGDPGDGDPAVESETDDATDDEIASGARYRTQRRGGKGLRDIKTTDRNGSVVSIARIDETDELMMMTARGKIQRIAADEISVIGRNTQGVRIMSLDSEDKLAAVVRVPREEGGGAESPEEGGGAESPTDPTGPADPGSPQTPADSDEKDETE
jgi:DNA gyrase subunit A